jgi:hypothetical protein
MIAAAFASSVMVVRWVAFAVLVLSFLKVTALEHERIRNLK